MREKQDEHTVLEKGIVMWYSADKNYGLIEAE